MSNLTQYKVVAGKSAGIKVTVTPNHIATYNQLVQQAASSHWARVCVASVNSLTSGHIKPNVFVEAEGAGKFPVYTLAAPGILIQFRKRSNSDYVIFNMVVTDTSDYLDSQKAYKRPGLFSVTKLRGEFSLNFKPAGDITPQEHRVVTISDQCVIPQKAVDTCDDAAAASPKSQFAKFNGFDMHFTPGQQKIGGLRRLDQAVDAATCKELRESAQLLAKTMIGAKPHRGVAWVAAEGGSGVLTQAMSLLKEQNFKFDTKTDQHVAFFYDPRTNLVKAEQLARDVGLKFERKSNSVNYLKLNTAIGGGLFGAHRAAYYRFKQDPEYTLLKFSVDAGKETTVMAGAGVVLKTTGIASGMLLGVAAVGAAILPKAGFTAVQALTKAGLPKLYKKIAGKL